MGQVDQLPRVDRDVIAQLQYLPGRLEYLLSRMTQSPKRAAKVGMRTVVAVVGPEGAGDEGTRQRSVVDAKESDDPLGGSR
jgi:hypothetical protein